MSCLMGKLSFLNFPKSLSLDMIMDDKWKLLNILGQKLFQSSITSDRPLFLNLEKLNENGEMLRLEKITILKKS